MAAEGATSFNQHTLSFNLATSPIAEAPEGCYHLIRKNQPLPEDGQVYRLSHPLGEHVLDVGRGHETPVEEVVFTLTGTPQRIAALEQLPSHTGWLEVNLLELQSFQLEEHLVFSAQADDGHWLDAEACQRLLKLPGRGIGARPLPDNLPANFESNIRHQIDAALAKAIEENNTHFQVERERLEQWAEDKPLSAEQAMHDTKAHPAVPNRCPNAGACQPPQSPCFDEIGILENHQPVWLAYSLGRRHEAGFKLCGSCGSS